jgi:hypothetical protein
MHSIRLSLASLLDLEYHPVWRDIVASVICVVERLAVVQLTLELDVGLASPG